MKKFFPSSEYSKYLGVGLQLAATVLGCFFAGYLADRKLESLPVFTLIGTTLGMVIGFVNLFLQFYTKDGQK